MHLPLSISTPASPDETESPAADQRWRIAVTAFYWASLAVATHWPPPKPPSDGGIADKVLHFLAYAILAWLLCWAWRPRKATATWRWAIPIALLLAVYGAIDERTQLLVGRSCELFDWLADLAGIAAGIAIYATWLKYSWVSAPDSRPDQST